MRDFCGSGQSVGSHTFDFLEDPVYMRDPLPPLPTHMHCAAYISFKL